MAKSHYEVLEVGIKSSQEEIRSAYRKIVLVHHPDRSSAPESKEIFLRATQAYEILSDPPKRQTYDATQRQDQIKAEQEKLKAYAASKQSGNRHVVAPAASPDAVPHAGNAAAGANLKSSKGSVTVEVTRLTMLFTRAQYGESERLAKKIIDQDPRQPIPYAVLGDLARQRGELQQAAKMYAFAVQMDPSNSLYQQRHEELLGAIQPPQSSVKSPINNGLQVFAPMVGIGIVLVACLYIILARETPLLTAIPFVSTWTFSLITLMFLSGVAIGASFSYGGLVDRYNTVTKNTLGRFSPYIITSFVALVQFWGAGVIYVLLGAIRRTFNYSITRLMGGTTVATLLFSAACLANGESTINPMQTLVWGGNVIYIGALVGWMVADSLQH